MLGALLERVLLQLILRVLESGSDVLELLALDTDFIGQPVVLQLQLLILVSLLWVQVIQSGLVREVNIVNLLLVGVELVLHVTLLAKQRVQVGALLVVLILDMQVERFDIFWLRVTSMLIKGQVVISEVSLELSDVLNQRLVFALERQIGCVVLVDVLDLLFHLVDLGRDIVVLLLQLSVVVVAIVDLPTRASSKSVDSSETSICDWSFN